MLKKKKIGTIDFLHSCSQDDIPYRFCTFVIKAHSNIVGKKNKKNI